VVSEDFKAAVIASILIGSYLIYVKEEESDD
jgi:hypothetical protein